MKRQARRPRLLDARYSRPEANVFHYASISILSQFVFCVHRETADVSRSERARTCPCHPTLVSYAQHRPFAVGGGATKCVQRRAAGVPDARHPRARAGNHRRRHNTRALSRGALRRHTHACRRRAVTASPSRVEQNQCMCGASVMRHRHLAEGVGPRAHAGVVGRHGVARRPARRRHADACEPFKEVSELVAVGGVALSCERGGMLGAPRHAQ